MFNLMKVLKKDDFHQNLITMRKIKLITFLTVILGFAIFSCTNESFEKNNQLTSENLEFVGIEHNMMLDDTYQFLKKEYSKKSYKNKSVKDKKDGLEEFLISRVKSNNKYSDQSNNSAIESIKNLFIESKKSSKSSTYYKNISSKLSDKEKIYLDDLYSILDETDFENDKDFEERISNLEVKIENEENLNDEQLITLFSATQTARYSYIYWKENWNKWIDLSKTLNSSVNKGSGEGEGGDESCESYCDNTKLQEDDNDGHNGCLCAAGGGVLKADAKGAVAGAVGAWVVNIVPGFGQIGYGSAIIGTAATTSALKVLDYIFGE